MALQLIVDNTIPLKPEETRELDSMIREAQKNVQITYKNVERTYEIVSKNLVNESHPIYQAIVMRDKVPGPIKNAQKIIFEHYLSESKEYSPNEFDDIYVAMAFGLGDVCAQRLKQRGNIGNVAGIKGEINDYMYSGIKSVYSNPNDLLFEYDFFKEWHDQEATELKSKTLTFFMDMLWVHAYYIKEKEQLLDVREKLKHRCSMIKNPELRASIIQNNIDLIKNRE